MTTGHLAASDLPRYHVTTLAGGRGVTVTCNYSRHSLISLEEAKMKADVVVEKAEKKAEMIVKKARKKADMIFEEAMKAGRILLAARNETIYKALTATPNQREVQAI